jgi:hypothetical protein
MSPGSEALLGFTLDHMSLPWTCGLGLHTCFVSQAPTFTHSHTAQYFHLAPWTWETQFHPKRWLLGVSLGVNQTPFCLLSQAWIWTQILTSLTGGTPLAGFCTSLGSIVHPRPSPQLSGRMIPSSGSNCLLVTSGITFLGGQWDAPWWQGRWKPLSLQSQQWAPKKCYGNLKLRYRTLRQFSRKQHFIVPAQTRWTRVQSLNPENKGVSPLYPCKQVTEAKSKV